MKHKIAFYCLLLLSCFLISCGINQKYGNVGEYFTISLEDGFDIEAKYSSYDKNTITIELRIVNQKYDGYFKHTKDEDTLIYNLSIINDGHISKMFVDDKEVKSEYTSGDMFRKTYEIYLIALKGNSSTLTIVLTGNAKNDDSILISCKKIFDYRVSNIYVINDNDYNSESLSKHYYNALQILFK